MMTIVIERCIRREPAKVAEFEYKEKPIEVDRARLREVKEMREGLPKEQKKLIGKVMFDVFGEDWKNV